MMLPIVTTIENIGISETAVSDTKLLGSEIFSKDFMKLLSLKIPNKDTTTKLLENYTSALSEKNKKQKILDTLTSQNINLSQKDISMLLTKMNDQNNLDFKKSAEIENFSHNYQNVTNIKAAQMLIIHSSEPVIQKNNSNIHGSNTVIFNDSRSINHNLITKNAEKSKNIRFIDNDQLQIKSDTEDSFQVMNKSTEFVHTTSEILKKNISNHQTSLTDHAASAALLSHEQIAMRNNIIHQSNSDQLNSKLGSTEWRDALGQKIIMLSQNGKQSVQLRLNPEELGALHISLQLKDNQIQIHLASANSQVRSALEAALPYLRSAMEESGINLDQSSVGSENSGWKPTQHQMSNNSNGYFSDESVSYQKQFATTASYDTDFMESNMLNKVRSRPVIGIDIFA